VQTLQRFSSGIASIVASDFRPHTRLGPGEDRPWYIRAKLKTAATALSLPAAKQTISETFARDWDWVGLVWRNMT
jgi:hypothetical protein